MIDSNLITDVDVLVVGAGQAGLAAGLAVRQTGLRFLIMDAGDQPGGSWPHFYDSLTLFSPARFSTLPGLRFPGRLGGYPTRDDMARYLSDFATHFELPVRTRARVLDTSWDGEAFELTLADGDLLTARAVIAASGGFGRPVIPELPGATSYTGRLVHSANYHNAAGYTGQRVVVVGAGNSAVQIAVELAEVANVTLANRAPIRFVRQAPLGIDLHYWARWSGLETPARLRRTARPNRSRIRHSPRCRSGRPTRNPSPRTRDTQSGATTITLQNPRHSRSTIRRSRRWPTSDLNPLANGLSRTGGTAGPGIRRLKPSMDRAGRRATDEPH
jgi:putative flavoprotein involved in K+ transport